PAIRSYVLESAENPTLRGRMVTLETGLHALIATQSQTILINPAVNERGESIHSSTFYTPDTTQTALSEQVFAVAEQQRERGGSTQILTDGQLRTYRIAIAADGEFSQDQGGTLTATRATIVSRVNDLNVYFQMNAGIGLQLVANNDALIFLDPATDPYLHPAQGLELFDQNIATLDSVIGSANYDIGQLFSGERGGGTAYIGAVCENAIKAGGISGDGELWIALHEIGHQFNANHTFNGVSRACSVQAANSAYEVGSGNSTMSYASFCGSDNVGERTLEFSLESIREIQQFVQSGVGATCGSLTGSSNQAPVIVTGTTQITLPASTPFTLVGHATDPDGDTLSYAWVEHDLGPAGHPNQPSGNAPLFRWLEPDADNTRTLPQMSDLLAGRQTIGELLPNYTRNLAFRFMVRDDGDLPASRYANLQVAIAGESGPFRVLSPNRGESWQAGGSGLVTWDVAGSDLPPVNCLTVNIDLSLDGGVTYPLALATNVANDGGQQVVVPDGASEAARVRVACATYPDHFFFDISDSDFEIVTNSAATFAMTANPQQVALCGGESVDVKLAFEPFAGFSAELPLTLTLPLSAEISANLPNTTTV
ncbi:MAG TPA: hypothetical protein ENJ56_07495, partial [Anaerolineae bacterium]|nr:hypothetical protein [Anaerolineae bacterium]